MTAHEIISELRETLKDFAELPYEAQLEPSTDLAKTQIKAAIRHLQVTEERYETRKRLALGDPARLPDSRSR